MASSVRLPSRVGHALFLDQVAPQTRLLEKRRQMFEVRRLSGTVGWRILAVTMHPTGRFKRRWKAKKRSSAVVKRLLGWYRWDRGFSDALRRAHLSRLFSCRRREEGLRRKDRDLQEALIRFNQILTGRLRCVGAWVQCARAFSTPSSPHAENEAKKTRAEKRAAEESRATVQKLDEITDQAEQFEQLRLVRGAAGASLRRMQRSSPHSSAAGSGELAAPGAQARALPEVHAGWRMCCWGMRGGSTGKRLLLLLLPLPQAYQAAHAEEFAEPSEVLERFETLVAAHTDLEGQQVRRRRG